MVQLAVSRGIKDKDLGKLKSDPESRFLLKRDDVNSAIEGLNSAKTPSRVQSAKKAGDP
jgi:hypothetical protein